jgi:hypothetical protein
VPTSCPSRIRLLILYEFSVTSCRTWQIFTSPRSGVAKYSGAGSTDSASTRRNLLRLAAKARSSVGFDRPVVVRLKPQYLSCRLKLFLQGDAAIFFGMRPNCPHKLTKTAGPLARRPSRLGRLELHARGTSAASSLLPLRVSRGSRRAASRGRHVRRLLQLRVSTLGASHMRVGPTPIFVTGGIEATANVMCSADASSAVARSASRAFCARRMAAQPLRYHESGASLRAAARQ